ncbi:MAG: histidinol-phosphatase HisJ family protein [Oscillospiraceae bacterium]|nr:histidinol-phosphatase HisJ family protein [Oscillospiraceae bacterium]
MSYKKILDLHTHTDNSVDGHHSTMYLCECAQAAGLRGVAFTDHIEIDFFLKDGHDRRAMQSYFEIVKARSAFTGNLLVFAGVELGQPMYDVPVAEKLISSLKYDIVLGAVHNLRDMQDFWFLDYAQYDGAGLNGLLLEYFREVRLMADWGKFDTLAHLTYPLRYMQGRHKLPVDIRDYSAEIDGILESLVCGGIALEINTSGLRQELKKTMPDEEIVARYRGLGGELITIGSDAHYAEHLGAGIKDGMALAQRCGFDHVTFFQKREPTRIPIE